MKIFLYVIALISVFCSCDSMENKHMDENPAAIGFNFSDSDKSAIAIADSVVMAHGGREAWDKTKYIRWNFFGSRRHTWNKHTGDLLIEGLRDSFTIRMNINDMTGDVLWKGEELSQPDSLSKYLQKGKEMWINDAYWLILPFKLKDSGVTLKNLTSNGISIGHDSLGRMEQLQLTFDSVGVTPQNKYVITIEGESKKIFQWDFFRDASDVVPQFSNKWTDYKQYGDIILSSGRGKYTLSEIAVGDSLAKYLE